MQPQARGLTLFLRLRPKHHDKYSALTPKTLCSVPRYERSEADLMSLNRVHHIATALSLKNRPPACV